MSSEVVTRKVEYTDPEGLVYEGYLAIPKNLPANTPTPGILVCPAFSGITEFEEERTRTLAQEGYIAFAADVYGKGKRGTTMEESMALCKPMWGVRRTTLRTRLLASLETLKRVDGVDKTRIGAIGYCFGGMCVFDLARYNAGLKAVVGFHGTLSPLPEDEPALPEESQPITTSIVIAHGDADSHIPIEKGVDIIKELRGRQADFQFVDYSNAQHAFTEPKYAVSPRPGIQYDEKASRRSWNLALYHLSEHLRGVPA